MALSVGEANTRMAKKKKEKADHCISCGIRLVDMGFTTFICPECENKIGRCIKCRQQGNTYVCPKCGFTGP